MRISTRKEELQSNTPPFVDTTFENSWAPEACVQAHARPDLSSVIAAAESRLPPAVLIQQFPLSKCNITNIYQATQNALVRT
jgi:hypothetical protein